MASIKWIKTDYPGIYSYQITKGKRYGIRIGYTKQNGKYSEVNKSGFKTIAAAKAYKNNLENQLYSNQAYLFESEKMTLEEWFEEYMTLFEKKSHSKDTIRHKWTIFNYHLRPAFGTYKLSKIKLDIYEKFLLEKLMDGLSVNTVITIHKNMKAILNAAVRYEKLDKNRLVNIEIKPLEEQEYHPTTKTIDIDKLNLFLQASKKALPKYDYALIYLAVWGMRRGEVMGVRYKDLEFDDKQKIVYITIRASRTLRSPEGKGTKTPASVRKISLDIEGYHLLKYALDKAKSIAIDYDSILHKDDFIFRNPKNNKPWAVTRLNDLLKTVGKETNMYIHPHMLRHTFTTQASLAGANRIDLQRFVGHKNGSMTDYYTHETKEGTQNLVNIIKEQLSKK